MTCLSEETEGKSVLFASVVWILNDTGELVLACATVGFWELEDGASRTCEDELADCGREA